MSDQDVLKEKVALLNSDKTKFAIVSTLDLMGPMNLRELSEFLGKKDPFVIRFIKGHSRNGEQVKTGLLEDGIIEIDQEMTNNNRGIYYRLTDVMKNFLQLENPDITDPTISSYDNQENPNAPTGWGKEDLDEMRQLFIKNIAKKRGTRHTSDLGNFTSLRHLNISQLIDRTFQAAIDETFTYLDMREQGEDYDIDYSVIDQFLHTDLNEMSATIPLSSREHHKKVYGLMLEFMQGLQNAGKEIEEENKKKLASGEITKEDIKDAYFYLYTGPLVNKS